MQRQCKSKDAWCGRCAERRHTSQEEVCQRIRRCLNCRDSSGNPEQGHCVWDNGCQFPKTVEMRKHALSRRGQDPWWWDSDNENRKRSAGNNANETASQQSAPPSTVQNAATHLNDDQTDLIQSDPSQSMITKHFHPVGQSRLDNNREQESTASPEAANAEMDDAQSIQSEDLLAPVVCFPAGVHNTQ